jgi:cytochrome c oxidase accessory protein FixG
VSDSRELPPDRLATVDERGGRLYLYPERVAGRFRRARTGVSGGLTALFLVLPWIRIHGEPVLLLDVYHRRFSIFGTLFWAHDAPLLLFFLGGVLLLLAAVTSVWGRVWCGWACPQTVFVDFIFRRIEATIEGNALDQRRLDQAPWSLQKGLKKTSKWLLFGVVSALISHSFVAYFVGTEVLAHQMAHAPWESSESFSSFLLMLAVLLLVLFDFGWFREQFCNLVCPYGRFQSILMDERSQVVAYDTQRGEPRRGAGEGSGDCVNCYRCVRVCPTGIDIRRGLQMECVACTACIDACDDVMRRLKKPEGLIRYLRPVAGLSFRSQVLGGAFGLFLLGAFQVFSQRVPLDAVWIRAVDTPYQQLPAAGGGVDVINHFQLGVRNLSHWDQTLQLVVPPGVRAVAPLLPAQVKAGDSRRFDVFFQFPLGFLREGNPPGMLQVQVQGDRFSVQKDLRLVGPLLGSGRPVGGASHESR